MTAIATDSMPTQQSATLLAELAKPSRSYNRRAWLAAGTLALFMALYALLAGWFLLTAYRLTFGAAPNGKDVFWGYVIGVCAAFLAVFMLKAFIFVKRGSTDGNIEVTPAQQPGLFKFLHQLADASGAPRPHRVFLSPRVNAAVFYDLSILNLLFPSRKNLEIGLGLVNALSVGELRAVLAHEFGHFTQRTMAVGRWGYIAQQIAAHLVAKRDKLDDILRGISNFDLRVAWIGWLLSLIVWSIRSVVDSVFRVVILMQRALSREMEMHADLVAVALTGSDALIHALHQLQAADDSWQRAVNFAFGEKAEGRIVGDVFLIQARIMDCMRDVMNDPFYGRVPPPPAGSPERHRLFKAELAQPPRMWLTHPLNHEREANAKQRYISAPVDERCAWEVFDNPLDLCKQMSAVLLDAVGQAPVPMQVSLQHLDAQFKREHLNGRYRGVYWGRSAVRYARSIDTLYDTSTSFDATACDDLYPPALTDDVEQLRAQEKEMEQLQALESGALEASGGAIRHRGRELRRSELPSAIAALKAEIAAVNTRLQAHDRKCRTWHLNAARQLGQGWPEYLRGLLAVLHYAEHTEADLRDAQGLLGNVLAIETAARRVSSAGVDRVLRVSNALYQSLDTVFTQHVQVDLDASLASRANVTTWTQMLGEFKLTAASRENLNEWLKVIDGWVGQAAGACAALRAHALEQLLATEAAIADHVRHGTSPEPAVEPSRVPDTYQTLLPGAERKRTTRLNWWARFQIAEGPVAATARFAVAGGIIAAMLMFGEAVGSATITIYNGLARPVTVQIGPTRVNVAALSSARQQVAADRSYQIQASTTQGQIIESFSADVGGNFANVIYNVASASPLVEWTATYGNVSPRPPRMMGAPRWSNSGADVLFAQPPTSISTKSGGGSREVLSGADNRDPGQALALAATDAERNQMTRVHALWDDTQSHHAAEWLWRAATLPDFDKLLKTRLSEKPQDVLLLRMEQDVAAEADKANVCQRQRALAKASPDSGDLQYVALRCETDKPTKDQALIDAYRRWPDNGWLANAAGYAEAAAGRWPAAQAALENAYRRLPAMSTSLAVEIVRIRRLRRLDGPQMLNDLGKAPESLRAALAVEGKEKIDDPDGLAYRALARGKLDEAMRLVRGRPESEARMLRLVAASDGATPTLVTQALSLDTTAGTDSATAWFSAALAAREGRDYLPYLQRVTPAHSEYVQEIRGFVDSLRQGRSPEAAEQELKRLTPEVRGYAYGMGAILLGPKAPRAWREAATRLLFAFERPYFA